jgi:hypothetical protein
MRMFMLESGGVIEARVPYFMKFFKILVYNFVIHTLNHQVRIINDLCYKK